MDSHNAPVLSSSSRDVTLVPPASPSSGEHEKRRAALSSVFAAVLLTTVKLVAGLWSGSLGVLSEALHSGLDLAAAGITLFAVRYAGRPADADHPYGHGKAENLSALFETLLLLATCAWIIVEAARRLAGKAPPVEASGITFAVMAFAIVIDYTRSRLLYRVARRYHSQALEADALHFSSDIISSLVVIGGLAAARFGWHWADPLAALVVSGLIMQAGLRLGRQSIDVLLDRVPVDLVGKVEQAVREVSGVVESRLVRLHRVGAKTFVEVSIDLQRTLSFAGVQQVADAVRAKVAQLIPDSEVEVITTPVAGAGEDIVDRIQAAAAAEGVSVHHVEVHNVGGATDVHLHLEFPDEMPLLDAHRIATSLEERLREELGEHTTVVTHIEPMGRGTFQSETTGYDEAATLDRLWEGASRIPGLVDVHDLEIERVAGRLLASMHCRVKGDLSVDQAHDIASTLEGMIRELVPEVTDVVIHAEP